MDLYNLVLNQIDNPQDKSILEVGSHDDSLSLKLSKTFKSVYAYYEYVKCPERKEGNLEIRKLPYLQVLNRLNEFDVILLDNEFHHFPDIWQMWTYEKLQRHQELLLAEWDFTGNFNYLYSSFQDCAPLCQITRQILNKFVYHGLIKIISVQKGKDHELMAKNEKDLIKYFKFLLPDYWKFGEKEFMAKISNITYPVQLWEDYDLFKIKRV